MKVNNNTQNYNGQTAFGVKLLTTPKSRELINNRLGESFVNGLEERAEEIANIKLGSENPDVFVEPLNQGGNVSLELRLGEREPKIFPLTAKDGKPNTINAFINTIKELVSPSAGNLNERLDNVLGKINNRI
jgi:hypothetical protein